MNRISEAVTMEIKVAVIYDIGQEDSRVVVLEIVVWGSNPGFALRANTNSCAYCLSWPLPLSVACHTREPSNRRFVSLLDMSAKHHLVKSILLTDIRLHGETYQILGTYFLFQLAGLAEDYFLDLAYYASFDRRSGGPVDVMGGEFEQK